ncbi:threonine aldolase [Streptococcus criceti]|uniref:Low specificity L-threonine aldolase n=1 Tax=Streptococcus criceti HS-6 TaxID=873449 RepID=G5JRC1_STRCG|nr:aminotransferase class I/II-fold pyridoxal phosphate-dependent enzyme [Streptococcus criceti]EHI74811.1 low specificity L-threonine aldolase [Streptococcus criceti HS-6]SUN43757.1 threonine aldolase [Streptococcus criceti]
MLHFENDYNEGVHPKLLEVLTKTNTENLAGYGLDSYTERASQKIKEACQTPNAQVFFLTGGTQTNQVVIDTMLAPYEGVLAAETGHIAAHEAGAIEYIGHKVSTLPHKNGKLTAGDVKESLENFYADDNHEHMVYPGMVYISHPTEYGALYSKKELAELAQVCRSYAIPLFLDGARLGYGLAAKDTDLDLPTIAELTDVFYIGGTKMGALIGEAVVFTHGNMPKRFNTMVKQHGALLAKGRILGIQFDQFFTDNLYEEIGKGALRLAEQLKGILKDKGYSFFYESPTNQQFVIVENGQLEILGEKLAYSSWEKYDDNHTVIRLATSWSTTQEDIDQLKEIL